jgi:pyrroline-5-carboxylate reductase
MQIAIIGLGNIGSAIANGLLSSNAIAATNLTVSDINQDNLKALKSTYPDISTTSNNKEAVAKSDVIIVAVKPWLVQPVLSELSDILTAEKLLVSIAAGIDFEFISNIITAPDISMFRVMPNTAISINESMTLIASKNAEAKEEKLVLDLFSKLGKAVLIEEPMMGAATSVASCGIAYALRYLRAASEGAVELGFKADVATTLVAQTMKGAAELILKNNSHPEVEIDKVTTPGGWTIKGLNEMEAYGFTNAVIKGLKANNG